MAPPSPTSSTSTVDQQEIILDEHIKPRPRLHHNPPLTPWKSLHHHFIKYSDVKLKPEKRDYSNEILHQKTGWKVHHVVSQLTGLIENECANKEKLDQMLNMFINDGGLKRAYQVIRNSQYMHDEYSSVLKKQRSYGRNTFEPDLIVSKMDDMLRGNVQRTETMINQLSELQSLDETYCTHSKYVVEVYSNTQKNTRRRIRPSQKNSASTATATAAN